MYATANLQNRYKQESVTTASPIDLVIMLYEGCIKPVSYTHLDVYKRQAAACEPGFELVFIWYSVSVDWENV